MYKIFTYKGSLFGLTETEFEAFKTTFLAYKKDNILPPIFGRDVRNRGQTTFYVAILYDKVFCIQRFIDLSQRRVIAAPAHFSLAEKGVVAHDVKNNN